MRHWSAAHALTTCGFAGCRIDEGSPVQVVELAGLKARYRCPQHAQGAIDWDEVEASKVSAYRPSSPAGSAFTKLSKVKAPIDVKSLAAGER